MEPNYIQVEQQTQSKIQCCLCATPIDPNPSNMCVNCLKSNVDISEGIPKQAIMYFCKGCERYQVMAGVWQVCALESRELLSLCIKKLKNINKIHLVDAVFLYTEPHSKRLKVKLTIQKEVFNGAILQQVFVVEYVVQNLFCDACHRKEANDYWTAVVQVRQKATHKKTLFYLEQLIIKHQAHSNTVDIKPKHEGIDFYFDKKDDAVKFVDFLEAVIPCKYLPSQQLISHDTHSNTYNYKFTYSVEVVPVCKDDIMCLPNALAKYLGNIGQICVCLRITNNVLLIDPFTLKTAELSKQYFFKYPFKPFATSRQLTNYTVMEVEPIDLEQHDQHVNRNYSSKHELADVWLIKTSELGKHDNYIHSKTHLGAQLSPGDTVLGFDVANSNVNDDNYELYSTSDKLLPDVIVVKKVHPIDRATRNARRKWKLRRIKLGTGSVGTTINNDFNEFMDDIEEDEDLRTQMNIYKNADYKGNDDEFEDDGVPRISVDEMLDEISEQVDKVNVQQENAMELN